jgi:hypothetical protein
MVQTLNLEQMKIEEQNSDKPQNQQLNILAVSGSFSMQDLFDAFSYYAFTSTSNQPYNEAELIEHFDEWFKSRFVGK